MLHDDVVANPASSALQDLRDPRALEALLPTFASDDERLRSSAGAIVGKLGEQAMAPLLSALESEDWRVRSTAAYGLQFVKDPRTLAPLTAALGADPNATVRAAAASALGFARDDRAIDALIDGLQDEEVRVRQASAQALFSMALSGRDVARALPALDWAFEDDEGTVNGQPVVKMVAERAIREIRGRMEHE
jgi:HEAT repeat protein